MLEDRRWMRNNSLKDLDPRQASRLPFSRRCSVQAPSKGSRTGSDAPSRERPNGSDASLIASSMPSLGESIRRPVSTKPSRWRSLVLSREVRALVRHLRACGEPSPETVRTWVLKRRRSQRHRQRGHSPLWVVVALVLSLAVSALTIVNGPAVIAKLRPPEAISVGTAR